MEGFDFFLVLSSEAFSSSTVSELLSSLRVFSSSEAVCKCTSGIARLSIDKSITFFFFLLSSFFFFFFSV